MRALNYLLTIILLSAQTLISGQQQSVDASVAQGVDRSTFESVKNEIDLSKTKKALRLKEVEQKKEEDKEEDAEKLFSFLNGLQSLGIFEILSYILIISLAAFLVFLIFSNIKTDKKFELSTENVSLDDIEDIQTLDTDVLLNQALAKGDYRGAVRIQFLKVLKDLSTKERINWRKEKTNRDYSRELRKEVYGRQFNELTTIFDYVWYGKQELPLSKYNAIDLQFISFTKLMNE